MSRLEALTSRASEGGELTRDQIAEACTVLLDGAVPVEQRADFLRALHRKGETPAEIAAFVNVLLDRAVRPSVSGEGLLDVCGTGGDKAGLFNISTAVMFVVAACGVPVVKHGNRGITSRSGGADVLEALGVRIDLPPGRAGEALGAAGCCFLFAPHYHPTFAGIVPVRKALAAEGTPTVFNLLGPLLNPARPAYQLTGVFNPNHLRTYAEVFRLLGRKRAWAVHGAGGLDEVSTLGPSLVQALEDGEIRQFQVESTGVGSLEMLKGGSAEENALMIVDLLRGALSGPKRDIVALNAACALVVAGRSSTLEEALAVADTALAEGAAFPVLEALRKIR